MFFVSCQSGDTVSINGNEPIEAVDQINSNGKELFRANCASCHNPLKDMTGPALKGLMSRVPDKEWIYDFVHNSAKMIAEGDKYANELYIKWGKTSMTPFPSLSNADIDSIIAYCEGYQ